MGETNTAKALWLLQRAGWQTTDICGVSDLPSVGMEHYCDHLVRLANLTPTSAAGIVTHVPTTSARPFYSLTVTPAMRDLARQWLERKGLHGKPLILIQAGNKRTMKKFGSRQRVTNTKYWPEPQWAEVLRKLRERHPEHAILLLGVPQEALLNDDIIRLAGVRDAYNIANDNSIPLLMGLAEKAVGMISVDTGPGHVAAATGCRVVTLFGQTDPSFYVPRGPVRDALPLTGKVDGKQSILGITPAQVMDAWQQLVP
jgi:heptosyltransferase-2/heptosyltransferase-3